MREKEIKNYIVLVDYHKPLGLKHNTAGRYRVGATSEKEAEQLVRNKIGFGSVQAYYQCEENDLPKLAYKTVMKEVFSGNEITYQEPRHANAPHKHHKNRK